MKNTQICIFLTTFCLFLFLSAAAKAQENRQDFFIAPITEVLGYGHNGFAYGGGFSFGYGKSGTLGINFLYAMNNENFIFMELQFFARYFLSGFRGEDINTGPFIQINAGPVLYSIDAPDISGYGSISTGLAAGWRFPLGDFWYIEPAIRGGYPFYYGAGFSTGLRW